MAATSSLDHLSNRMKLEWHSKLNTEMVPAKNFRRTSIIGTIGMSFCQPTVQFQLVGKKNPGQEYPANRQSITGPKTNSAEKINALRRGTAIISDGVELLRRG
jgi:pyruvate kinase